MSDENSNEDLTLEEALEALREESPGVEWYGIGANLPRSQQKVAFWDTKEWHYIKNPYRDGKKQCDPKERYPDLSEAGLARMNFFNG